MPRFQLCSRDEYGQTAILKTSEKLEEISTEGRRHVTDLNVNNALTMTDRDKNWEAYLPILTASTKKLNDQYVFLYGGKGPLNKDLTFAVDRKTGSVVNIEPDVAAKLKVQIYLGNVSTKRGVEEDWFAVDIHRRPIEKLDHPELRDKTIFYVKAIQ